MQPTIVDSKSFLVWKDEAFGLWINEWGPVYDDGSNSRKLLQEVYDNWFLVSLVENDFVTGNIFKIFNL